MERFQAKTPIKRLAGCNSTEEINKYLRWGKINLFISYAAVSTKVNTMSYKLVGLCVLSILIASCSRTTVPTPASIIPATPSALPVLTDTLYISETLTPTPLWSGISVEYNGVSLTYPDDYARNVSAHRTLQRQTGASIFYPPHIEFTFLIRSSLVSLLQPRICVYAVSDFERVETDASAKFQTLRQILMEQPTDPENISLPTGSPETAILTPARYMEFQSGLGVQYFTTGGYYLWLAPSPVGVINNQYLSYYFHGLTHDGKYYVTARFPVNAPFLLSVPDHRRNDQEARERLDSLDASGFTPDLTLLDSIIRSLRIEPLSDKAMTDMMQIIFASNRDGDHNLYIMNSDGSGLTRLTESPANEFAPSWGSWSWGEQRIAFVSDQDGNQEIYTMDFSGLNRQQVTNHLADDFAPTWVYADIVFVSTRDGNQELYWLPSDGFDGYLSPLRMTSTPTDENEPAWGRAFGLVFDSYQDGNWELYRASRDPYNPEHITDLARLTSHPARDVSPTLSPDGKQLAFTTNRDGNFEIYVMDTDGSNPLNLTQSPGDDIAPGWSPDGQQIVFQSNRDGDYEIYVINIDGSGLTRLTNNPSDDITPAWSPEIDISPSGSSKMIGRLLHNP